MQRLRFIKHAVFGLMCLTSSMTFAETNYVIDELKIGIHENQATDSPILKLVPSGTALFVLERNNGLVQVQDPEGVKGWVHSKYLIETKPGRAMVTELEKQNASLKKEIELLKTVNTPAANTPPKSTNETKELEQQLKSERLKVGELQAQLTELRAHIPSIGGTDKKLLEEIEQLKEANDSLVNQLESSGIEVAGTSVPGELSLTNWKQILITALIIFVLGLAAGAFILDYVNRRRHGGFRV